MTTMPNDGQHDLRQDADVVHALRNRLNHCQWRSSLAHHLADAVAANGRQRRLHCGIDRVQPQHRSHTHHQRGHRAGPDGEPFSNPSRSGSRIVHRMRHLADRKLADTSRADSTRSRSRRSRQNSVNRLRLERSAQHQELSDESIEQRQAHRRQHDEQEERRIHRHGSRQSAELRNLVSVAALVQNARPA